MDCKGCGKCCINKKDLKWIEVSAKEALKIPVGLLQEGDIELFAMKQFNNGRCICLWKNNECLIYEDRPEVCRVIQQGSQICKLSLESNK
jgi:Fe-S-cluster containining protein